VVLCSTSLDSGELHQLVGARRLGCSISPIPGFDDERYLVEGDPLAIRQSKSLVEYRYDVAAPFAIERPLKPFFLAALTWHRTLRLPCSRWRRNRCIARESRRVFQRLCWERQLTRTLRSFLKRRPGEPIRRRTTFRGQLQALSTANPELSRYLRTEVATCASHLMEKATSRLIK